MTSSIYSFNPTLTNQLPKGIAKVFVKKTSESNYSSLGFIRDGDVKVFSANSGDTYLREFPFATSYEIKFKMLQASLIEIELMDALCAGDVDMIVQFVDGLYLNFPNATNFPGFSFPVIPGIKAKLVSAGGISKDRFIEVEAKTGCLFDTITSIITPTATLGTPLNTDTFYTIASSNPSSINLGRRDNIRPAGFAKVEIAGADEGENFDDVGRVMGGSLEIDFVSEDDEIYRHNPYGVDINFSFDLMQSSLNEIGNLINMYTYGARFRITQPDGLVWNFANNTNVSHSFESIGNFEGHRIIKLTGKGRMVKSSLDGIVS